MPRAFLYKKKRKGGPKSKDGNDFSYGLESHGEDAFLRSMDRPDPFLVPFYLQPTTKKMESELSTSKPEPLFTFPKEVEEDSTKVDKGGDISHTLKDASKINGYPAPRKNISSNSELQKALEGEKRDTKSELFELLDGKRKECEVEVPKLHDIDSGNPKSDRMFYPNSTNKLREYLESFSRKSASNEESMYTVSDPLNERSSRLLSKTSDAPDSSFAFLSRNWHGSPPTGKPYNEDQKWNIPMPRKDKTTAFPKVGATFEPTTLNSLYQSYLYSATYYNSLQLRAWRNALPVGNSVQYKQADSKDPCVRNGRSPVGSYQRTLAGFFNFPLGSDTIGMTPPSATAYNYLGMPFGKTGARQPVPGIEYVKNKIDLEVSSISGDISLSDSRATETSPRSTSPVNDFMSGTSASKLSALRLPGLESSTPVTTDHKTESAFPKTSAQTILATPTPQTYRGGRRSASGKPPQPRKYVCDVCGKAFSRSNTLVTHKRIHTGDKPFACELCGRAFRQPGNLTRHRLTHTTVKPYVCTQCGKAFNRASNLHTHMRTHTNYKPFICQFCGKGFHQKIDMKIHSYTHTGEKPHKCKKCGRGFKQLTHLTYHMRTHSEVKMYTCNYCGKGFNQKGNLQAHIYRHTGERPHQCDICNKGFTLASTLNTHRRTHAEKKPFACQHCGKDFYQKNALKSHLIASHPYVDGDSLL